MRKFCLIFLFALSLFPYSVQSFSAKRALVKCHSSAGVLFEGILLRFREDYVTSQGDDPSIRIYGIKEENGNEVVMTCHYFYVEELEE